MRNTYSGKAAQRVRVEVWNAYPHVCHLCNGIIASFIEMEPDHIVPRSKGGHPFDMRNLRPAHGTRSKQRCNQRRGNKSATAYRKTRERNDMDWFI